MLSPVTLAVSLAASTAFTTITSAFTTLKGAVSRTPIGSCYRSVRDTIKTVRELPDLSPFTPSSADSKSGTDRSGKCSSSATSSLNETACVSEKDLRFAEALICAELEDLADYVHVRDPGKPFQGEIMVAEVVFGKRISVSYLDAGWVRSVDRQRAVVSQIRENIELDIQRQREVA